MSVYPERMITMKDYDALDYNNLSKETLIEEIKFLAAAVSAKDTLYKIYKDLYETFSKEYWKEVDGDDSNNKRS